MDMEKRRKAVMVLYVNRGDIGNPHDAMVDTSHPLMVTSAGHYRLHTVPQMHTYRPDGRADYLLIYVADGVVRFLIDGQERPLEKGTVVLFRPYEVQDFCASAEKKSEYYWCHFTGAEVEAALTDSGIPTRETVFYAGSSSDYQWLFLQMVRELQAKQQGYEEILRMNLRHLCLLIGRHRTAEQTPDEKTLGEIESAIRFFSVRYYQNFDIKAYAKQHWMTPHWFAQNFKKATGASPKQYIIALRIANAKHLLDNTSDTIAQIAAAVGYENTPYFHRLFHKQTGMTPLEYRHRPR